MRLAAVLSIAVAALVHARPLAEESAVAASLDLTPSLPEAGVQVLRTDDRNVHERRPRPSSEDSPRRRRPHHHSEEELDDIQIEFSDAETLWTHGHHHVEMEDEDEPRESSHRGPSHRRPESTADFEDRFEVVTLLQRPHHSSDDDENDFQLQDHLHGGHRHGPPSTSLAGFVSKILGLAPPPPHSHHGCLHSSHERPSFDTVLAGPESDVAPAELDAEFPPQASHHPRQGHHIRSPHALASTLLFALAVCFKLAVVGSVAVVATRKLKQVVRARSDAKVGIMEYRDVFSADEKTLPAYDALGEVVVVAASA